MGVVLVAAGTVALAAIAWPERRGSAPQEGARRETAARDVPEAAAVASAPSAAAPRGQVERPAAGGAIAAPVQVPVAALPIAVRPTAVATPVAVEPAIVAAVPAARLGAKLAHGGSFAAFVRRASAGALDAGDFSFTPEHAREADDAFVALPAGEGRIEGWLIERADERTHLRGWFELPAGATDVWLSFTGRFVDVELAGDERGELAIEAAPRPGWRPPLHAAGAIAGGETRRVWVPSQAAALVVSASDGRRARALLADGVASVRLRLPARGR